MIELLGPFGLSESLYGASSRLASADTGSISTYGLYIFVGATLLLLALFGPALTGMEGVIGEHSIRLLLLYGAAIFYMTASSSNTGTAVTRAA